MNERVSHYRIEGEIGRGGMGVVYRAVDTKLGRQVALKVLPREATTDPERHRRFVQEARAASALNHPNIVTIHDIDEDEGTTFIAMELVEGTPLDRLLAQGPLPIATALDYAMQAASALAAAHEHGIVHRDVKPANVMVTRDGRVKVLDFGLAKLVARGADEQTMTGLETRPGMILGTAAYMSPEQAEGHAVDARSDVFSFGVVLYEMLAGRRPFAATSNVGLLTAILRDQPAPLRSARSEVPSALQPILDRSLAKEAAARYASVGEVRDALAAVHDKLTRPAEAGWRRPVVVVPLVLLLLAVTAFAVWQVVQARRTRWARQEAIPQIAQLIDSDRPLQAVQLARQAERYVPDDVADIRKAWLSFSVATEPEGADVELRDYLDVGGAWVSVGNTPIRDFPLPLDNYRMRLSKEGYLPLDVSVAGLGRPPLALTPEREAQPGMVRVAGGPFQFGVTDEVSLPDFWIDTLEVTNRQFKRFVDEGGYRDQKYWKEPFVVDGRTLSFGEAMERFVDATGRPGPSTWEMGSHPVDQAEFPVGGISWYEAAAYAEFVGKTLPTLYHWYRASGADQPFSDILQFSNVDGKGPVKAGELEGIGPWGTRDMAGNVKEWCANEAEGSGWRYVLGGSWNEPGYRFTESDAQDPWQRQPTFGVRLVKNLGPADEAARPIGIVKGDPDSVTPVGDELFEVYKRFYVYDRTPLNARIDSVDETPPDWRVETVSFDAAYGGERVPAYLFLPRNAKPPYQTVVLFPSAIARLSTSSRNLDYRTFDFIIRSGRALIYPVYQGTYERRQTVSGPSARRDLQVQWAKDFFRAVDYLESRPDVDMDRLGYYSLSMGAYFGPIPVSLEPRIKLAVFAAVGMRFGGPPETLPTNFAPRVKVPVLIVNGRDDFQAPLAEQRRLLELLGTPAEDKRHATLEGGHIPNDFRGLIREVLDWLDRYFGKTG